MKLNCSLYLISIRAHIWCHIFDAHNLHIVWYSSCCCDGQSYHLCHLGLLQGISKIWFLGKIRPSSEIFHIVCNLYKYKILQADMSRKYYKYKHYFQRLDAWLIVNETEISLLSTLFVATVGSQWKRTRLIKLWKFKHYLKQTELCYSWLIFPIEVSYERAEIELYRNVILTLKFRYCPPNDLFVSSLQIDFNHSCVKYKSKYELHQMKGEDPSFANMCHLIIIMAITLW